MAKKRDEFPQKIYLTATESANNTLTFSDPIYLGSGIGDKRGFLIDKIEYVNASLANLVAAADKITAAITVAETSTLSKTNAQVIHTTAWQGVFAYDNEIPMVHNFHKPLLIPAIKLYCAVEGASLGAVSTVQVIVYGRPIDLSSDEYLELVQSVTVVTS